MSEKYLLIKCGSNYSDEFDVDCFQVMTESEWESHKKEAAKRFSSNEDEVGCLFGTNESVFWSSLEDYLDQCSVTELSEQDYQTMKKCFGNEDTNDISFGMTSIMFEDYDDEDESENDEEESEDE